MSLLDTSSSVQFNPPPKDLQPPLQDSIHLWKLSLSADLPPADSLSENENAQLDRFRFQKDRDRFLITHVAIRAILANYLQTEPIELIFETGPWGKPSLSQPASTLEFSLSHSHNWALLAVSSKHPVGVDLEYHKMTIEFKELSTAILTQDEQQEFNQLDPTERAHYFFKIWSAKEAFLKCLGTGLSIDPREVEVITEEPSEQIHFIGKRPSTTHHLKHLSFHSEYSTVLCTPKAINTLHCYAYS